ncbi:transposase [Pseudomonas sp. MAFF 301380]|uniref:Transposase n=1 Tax=Pseudomonas lactucae TaxID=2813360 RepID=A0A9X0YBF8_9PSED|nr:transposase [Pseudomonas lactucae]MBN2987784.1 transposase [Pseudomonas lactucae]
MRQRSSYPKPFKAQVAQECLQSGATISSVAIHHGINGNGIRKWLPIYRHQSPATLPAFVPVKAVPRRATHSRNRHSHTPQVRQAQRANQPGASINGFRSVIARICKDAFITRIEIRKMPWTQ